MGFFGRAQYHADADNGWDRYSNPVFARQEQEPVQVAEQEEDEWELMRRAARNQDLRFSVSRGRIRVGRAEFAEDEDGVNEAWEYLGGAA
jgi:hypothetical protein